MPTFSQFAAEHLVIPGRGPAPQTSLADVPPRPYTYGGTDTSTPPAPVVPFRPTPPSRGCAPLDDPEWLAAEAPLCAPREWLAELDREATL